MNRLANYNTAQAQITVKDMPVRVLHAVDRWEQVRDYNWQPHKIEKPRLEVIEFLRELLPRPASRDQKYVLIWAALSSRESYETILAEPALIEHYLAQATAELNYSVYKKIRG